MLILKSSAFILKTKSIKEEKEVYDMKQFLDKLEGLNKLISVDSPIRFKIQEGDVVFYATMIHSGNISLCKEFGSKIEKESIELLLNMAQLDESTDVNQSIANSAKGHTVKKSNYPTEESSKPREELFYDSQKAIGQHIYEKIIKKLLQLHDIQSESDMLKTFKDFKFLILLPNRVSLDTQTKSRLTAVQEEFPESCITTEDHSNVLRICLGSEMQRAWDNFIKEAERNPNKLYLVIHDECHWASGENQSAFKFMGFPEGDYHYTRDEEQKLLPNLFTLMVSATPYNIYTLIQDKSKIVSWKEYLKSQGKEGNYQGLTELRKQGKVIWDEKMPQLPAESDILVNNGLSEVFVQIILDYLDALKHCKQDQEQRQSEPRKNGTEKYLKRCIEEKKLIVIRVSKAKKNIRQSVVAREVLNKAINRLKLKMEVCINAETNPGKDQNEENQNEVDQNEDDTPTDFNYKEHMQLVQKSIQRRMKKNDIKEDSISKMLQFSDVEHIPMIMIIVERGRMGDTFPPNCVCFDLRGRYLTPVKDFTSIIQDVGRAFGYGERPTLLLSKEADKFLGEIWDTATDSLSMEALKRKTNVSLGNHMQRTKKGNTKPLENVLDNKEGINNIGNDDQEDDEPLEEVHDLQLVHQIFLANPNNPMFLYDLGSKAFEHRLVLKAEPQNGKTGAFLYLIKLFCEKIRQNVDTSWENPLSEHTRYFYCEKTNEEIEREFKTLEGQERHRDYINLLKFARDKRTSEGIIEPAKWAALALVDHLKNYNQNEITIADFGCGDMQFAKFFINEVNTNEFLQKISIILIGCDFSTNPIPTKEDRPLNTSIFTRY